MAEFKDYPGTPQHQALLSAVVSYYADDPRILAVAVFGSLGRGTWDRYSDLDLDVVISADVVIDVVQELTRLCNSFAAIGERAALIIPDNYDAGDVVLESLLELSIRYHPLNATSPNIVDSLRVLMGQIDHTAIATAGQANRRTKEETPDQLLDRLVRYAVEVDVALQRRQIWSAVDLLHRMRTLVMELFTNTRNGARPLHIFQAEADTELQSRLAATLPQYNLLSAQRSLLHFLGFLEHDLDELASSKVQLRDSHRQVLKNVRMRQSHLNLGGENES